MNPLGLFSQVGAVAIALTIGYFYVQPTISEIGIIQDDIATYKAERVKIEDINNQLATKRAAFDSISRSDKERLSTYMPRSIDDVSIMRDISFILEQAGVVSRALFYEGPLKQPNTVFSQSSSNQDDLQSGIGSQPATPHSFVVEVQGTYQQVKTLLRLLEQNEYPLEVHQLFMSADEVGIVSLNMELVTYVDELVLVNSN